MSLGHNLHLSHGGAQSGSWDVTCKPNYPSVMSYAGLYDSTTMGFSRKYFGSLSLNPRQMNELTGLGTTDPEILNWLSASGGSFRYLVDSATGSVDWNRDGRFSSGTVRAATTWGWGAGGCEQSGHLIDKGPTGGAFSALTWLPGSGSQSPMLFWFTRSMLYHRYRTTTTLPNYCSSADSAACKANWTPTAQNEGSNVPGSLFAIGAPSATWYYDYVAGEYRVMLVMRFSDGRMWSNTYSRQSGWGGGFADWHHQRCGQRRCSSMALPTE